MRRLTEKAVERLDRSELRRFFTDVFLKKLRRDGASSSHVEIHAAAVEHVERFCKRPLSPAELDDELLLNFDSYLWRQQVSDNRRRNLVESLSRIARAYQPGPTLRTNRRHRRPLPAPAAGTLRHFYETIDVPQRLAGRSERYIEDGRMVFYRLHEHFGRDVLVSEQRLLGCRQTKRAVYHYVDLRAVASGRVTWSKDHSQCRQDSQHRRGPSAFREGAECRD